MDFFKSPKRRSLLSEIVYSGLNIGLAVAILVLIIAIKSPLPAFLLLLLSKWRVFAVRPRFWLANVQANLVDTIVGASVIVLLYTATGSLVVQIALVLLYVGWLLLIKPRSKRVFVAAQAGIAILLGVTALMSMSYNWPSSLVVAGMWLIGYSAARQVISSYEESHRSFYSMLWGFVFAELGWLTYHWTFAYTIPGLGGIKLSQAALVALAMSFVAERIYNSYSRHETIKSGDVILPILLGGSVILVIMIFFNTLAQTNI